jgi:type III secretion protein J
LKKLSSLKKCISLCLLFVMAAACFSSCESRRIIVNGLEEKDANEILVYLSSKDINASKVPSKEGQGAGGAAKVTLWDIAVDPGQATEAMSILNAAGLPRRRPESLLNLFSAGGLVPSEMQDKIRYQAGLAAQIASTIRKIDGVLDADVQLSFPEEDPLNPAAPKGKVTASVYVKHTGVLDDPNSHLVTKIKRLVSSSVNGLDFDNVTVIGDKARYSDVTIPTLTQGTPEKFEYVKVWSLVIAKDSLSKFQQMFFAFCMAILFLLLALFWLGWKLYPLLKKRGGFKMLLHLSQLPDEYQKPEDKAKTEDKPKDDDTKPKDDTKGPKIQENVESL